MVRLTLPPCAARGRLSSARPGPSFGGSAASPRRPAEDHVSRFVAVGGPSRRDGTTLGGIAPRQLNLSDPCPAAGSLSPAAKGAPCFASALAACRSEER